jgi:hypothetical protein
MAELYLKNSTGSTVEVADIGLVIANNQSIPIDENDFDGYLTSDLIAALADDPDDGLILSTTDHPDTSGDLPKTIAQERIQLKTHWKPSRSSFANLPSDGNEDGDIRLVTTGNILYRWNQTDLEWQELTSTLEVTEIDGDPLGTNITKLVFVQPEDSVYVDQTNRTAYIGPPTAPGPLTAQNFTITGTTTYTGGLSDSNINYKTGDEEGSIVNYIINDAVFELATSSTSTRCDFGDQGLVVFTLNGTALVTVDLAANFVELNRESNQSMADYDNTGTGDPVTNGIANFTGSAAGKGYLQILSVGMYNGFKYYQKWTARVVITDNTLLRQGWNEVYLEHTGITPAQQSNVIDLFYDIDTRDAGANPSINTPTVAEVTPAYQYLSGVKYYGDGSTWKTSVVGSDCFDNVYHSSNAPIVFSGWPGMSSTPILYSDASVSGVSDPPDIGESMTVTDKGFTQAANAASADARITATPRDPYGSYTPQQSASDKILVWSWGNTSTDLVEPFQDENYRLLDGSYDSIPGSITGQWDSTEDLDTYDDGKGLQLYMDELYFPTIDFSVYYPTGNPNYSLIAGETNKTYFRALKHTGTSHAHGTLRLNGITKTQLYNRDVKVWIKLPTQTGWLDLTRDYNYATFTGIDDDGCWVDRYSQTNSDFKFSSGHFYTQNSGWIIIVKILYPSSSAPRTSHMQITDW